MRAYVLALLATAVAGGAAAAQVAATHGACPDTARVALLDFTSADRDLGRVLQLAGALGATPALLRRASTERERLVCGDAAWLLPWTLEDAASSTAWHGLGALPATLDAESTSGYRKDRNNGALRGGVGTSWSFGWGAELSWRGLSASFHPRVIHHANGDFPIRPGDRPGFSPFAYHIALTDYSLDFPQRFGLEPETRLDPGQSYLRIASQHLEFGVSTENFWLGAAQVYPILVSATAPGFPHVFLGTVEPLDAWIARVGMHVVVGQLAESDYFDTDPGNDRRPFSALVVEVVPRWTPGLHLGVARVNEGGVPPEGLSFGDYFSGLLNTSITFRGKGNLPGNGMGVLMARWVFPEAGFEAYAEWAREDTPYNLRDLIEEPDWTQAYALGFHQLVALGSMHLRWYGELVHLGEAAPVRAGKGFVSYYTHNVAIHGHTNQGQILGAAPGPGSDAQILGLDAFHAHGRSGIWLERTRYDDDTYYRVWARMYGESRHDVEWGIGVRHAGAFGPLNLNGELLYNRRANRLFLGLEDRTMPRREETNLGLRLRAAWSP